jgi:tRNA nucleotidyltransferase (CCA-adding enzyme)
MDGPDPASSQGSGSGRPHPYHAAMPHRHAAVPVPERVADMLDAALDAASGLALYLVGGAIRDLLRGDPGITDVDLAVDGDAAPLARRLARALGSPARVTVHAAFGTSTVRWEDMRVDIARTRSESYARPGSLPAVEPAGIEADLLRRDFTVNSMALRLGNGDSLLDPAGGRGDLERRVIRVLHRASFRDDPTRVFRAVRYAARLGFELDPDTDELARAALRDGLVGHLSGSRLRAELLALLSEATAPAAVGRLGALGACRAVWPGLDCDPQTQALLERVELLRQRYSARTPAWRCALVVLARGLPDADLPVLAHRLVLRKRDAATLRGSIGVPVPADDAGPAAVAEVFAARPVEAALLAAGAGSSAAATYLDHLRGVQLSIDGGVLRDELGLPESPRVGEVLRELLRRKRNGELETREAEIAAARELLGRAGP